MSVEVVRLQLVSSRWRLPRLWMSWSTLCRLVRAELFNVTPENVGLPPHTSSLLTTSQRLKEDEDRAEYRGNTACHGTDCVRGSLGVGNQIEECEAHDQEDDELLDPCHVGLLILSVLIADYSK